MNAKSCSCVCSTLLLLLSSPAFAEEWVKIGLGGSGDSYYYDAASVSKSGANRVTYWGKVEFASSASTDEAIKMRRSLGLKTAGYSKLKVSFALEEIDCKLRKSRNLAAKDLDQNGKVLDQRKVSGPWEDILPGTVYDRIHTLICH